MYTIVLFAHSWTRWILVILAVALVVRSLAGWVRSGAYTSTDKKLTQAFFWVLNVQFILGLALYLGLSPFMRTAFSNIGATMGESSIRFYVAEHIVIAILAIAAGHIGIARAKKAVSDKKKHLSILIGSGVSLLFFLAAIPWPNLPYGRALFYLP